MERVQFQQEEMLAELKDLVQKKLFTLKETRIILQRRTQLERALVRRIPHKSDFLRYIDYERGLELLRRKRVKRVIGDGDGPSTISDYALVRRQFHLFERALKKFKADIGLWIQYIELATKEGASTLVGRICARAIQLHPTSAALYILAASHELRHGSPSAARTLLQRGIRLNDKSIQLWREYVTMELGFIDSLKRRWDILGINPDRAETQNILDGAIVRSVLEQAFRAVPSNNTLELFEALQPLLNGPLLDQLYALLEETMLPVSADALRLILQHTVRPDMNPEDLVDAMKQATDKITKCNGADGSEQVVIEFRDYWMKSDIDEALPPALCQQPARLSSLPLDDDDEGPSSPLYATTTTLWSMLQYTVVPPTLANSPALDNPDYFRNNDRLTSKRVPKDTSSPILSNFPDHLQTTAKSPRSPYISAREPEISPPPRPSSIVSTIDDVLAPGDSVKEGGFLQGEPLRLVSIGSKSLPEDEEPAREFEVVRRLGAGSYAVVYLVLEVLYRPPPSDDGHLTVGQMDLVDKPRRPSTVYGREYAIKCLSKANLDEEALAAQMSEVTIHQSLRTHPNIVTLYRTLETSSFLLLLLEYVPGEDLFYFLEQARDHYDTDSPNGSSESSSSRTPPTPSLLSTLHPSQLLSRTRLRLISSMFSQMCDAVAACHDQQVFHRDIKPENFIVTDGWTTHSDGRSERKVVVKLTDFGLSTTDIESSDMDCGSAPYMSYECRNNIAPTYRPRAADVWSLGIVLINMLYHCNPWTDTAQYACSSFDLYRHHPISFFLQRFAGMTRPVAQLLADRVFNILEDSKDDSARISAKDFGDWAKELPDLLGPPAPSATPNAPPLHRRHTSVSSITGHPISSAVPPSHRPSSRQATPVIQPRTLAGLPVSRPPSLGPALVPPLSGSFTRAIDQDLVVEEAEEELEPEPEQEDNTTEGTTSRSTSTNKRRKRGARKGKGLAGTPTTPKDETLVTLASASQTLARELSKASLASSRYTDSTSIKSGKSGRSTWSAESTKSKRVPFEPPSMFGIPSALLSAGGPAVLPPIPPVPPLPSLSTTSVTTQTTSLPTPVTKKPSKWKLSFGKNSGIPTSGNGRASPVDEAAPSTVSAGTQTQPLPAMSATASNVTSLIMGLNAPPPHSAPVQVSAGIDEVPSWSRGRRMNRSPNPSTFSITDTGSRGDLKAPSVPRSIPSSSSPSRPYFASPSPIPSIERGRERARWNPSQVDNDGRAVSPGSARTGRHPHLASSASSTVSSYGNGSSSGSSNWRNSTSSAGTSTSAFTHYSNSSVKSVSTMATSVSSNSWRNGNKSPISPTSPVYGHPPGVPKNIKIMDGVPWELNQVPRGQHPNPDFGKPPPRKVRTRKPKDLKLDTITERPPASAGVKRSPDFLRQDASTSTTDLGGASSRASVPGSDDGDWQNKKVQRGQINALAKMLSALRR